MSRIPTHKGIISWKIYLQVTYFIQKLVSNYSSVFSLIQATRSYLRELAKEFNVSTNSVREELNQLTKTKLLTSKKSGRQVFYKANQKHPLFPELKSMVGKVMGIDQVIDGIVTRLGDLERAYLLDDYAEGKDTGHHRSFACRKY